MFHDDGLFYYCQVVHCRKNTASLRSASQDVNQWSFTRLNLLFSLSDFLAMCTAFNNCCSIGCLNMPFLLSFSLLIFCWQLHEWKNDDDTMKWMGKRASNSGLCNKLYFIFFLCMEFHGGNRFLLNWELGTLDAYLEEVFEIFWCSNPLDWCIFSLEWFLLLFWT